METEKYTNTIHLGRKIERVRRLRGMTQAELGDLLGITKQAVSKIEQTEKFDDERLGEIASALGVTVDGLKSFNEETILYNTNNFYENCGVKSAVSNTGNNQTFNSFPVEQVIEIFEKLLDKQKEQFVTLKKEKLQSSGIECDFYIYNIILVKFNFYVEFNLKATLIAVRVVFYFIIYVIGN